MNQAAARQLRHERVRAIEWRGGCLRLLDQRLLPREERYLELHDARGVAGAIADMAVRGAPAIGITAAYGAVLAARQRRRTNPAGWRRAVEADLERLARARPTAVNLRWALGRMRRIMDQLPDDPLPALEREARAIHAEDIAANRRIGANGVDFLKARAGILTHCNTGSLATGGYGTALGVIRSAFARGLLGAAFATETRPWLQGARLTAWELERDAIPFKLIADDAADALLASGRVQWVITGADRITANGDVVNKIGTRALAEHARRHGVGFMVAAPVSTIDPDTPSGSDVPIERRPVNELAGSNVTGRDWSPVFDVTPAELVDVMVTERGVVERPDGDGIRRHLESGGGLR